ncbi:unnamed protein product, partial [Polarella glacialis]
ESFAPFVATSLPQVDRILSLASVVASDVVCDLGCGDAAVLRRAALSTGRSCIGVEVDHELVLLAREICAGDAPGKVIITEDILENYLLSPSFASATVIFVHLVPDQLKDISSALQGRIGAGVRVVAQRYSIPGMEGSILKEIPSMPSDADSYFQSLGAAWLYGLRDDQHATE